MRELRLALGAGVGLMAVAGGSALAQADGPFRIDDIVSPQSWLEVSGETRLRYESLDGQFRAGIDGSDQFLAHRTLLKAQASFDFVTLTAELQDSRGWLDDEGTPLSTSFVNAAEFIQANATLHLKDLIGPGSEIDIKAGRMTVDIGSERIIERNGFRNTINAYDGLHVTGRLGGARQVDAIYLAPVRAQPRDFDALSDNRIELDRTDDNQRFYGLLYTDKQFLRHLQLELYGFGLDERDTSDRQTADRELYTFGGRLLREPSAGAFDFELEGAVQTGTRLASSDPLETRRLDVGAGFAHLTVGYTLDAPWQPRFAFVMDYASGDGDPDDLDFDGFDRLFGERRADLGYTSINGPFVRSNIVAPGVEVHVEPTPRSDAFVKYQATYLDSATDSLSVARLRDPTGQSGTFVGHLVEVRYRYSLIPQNLRVDVGGSVLEYGRFLDEVPGGPEAERTLYGFTQLVLTY